MAPAARKNAAMQQAVMGLEIIEDGSKKGESDQLVAAGVYAPGRESANEFEFR